MSSRSTRTKRSREDDSTKDVSPKHQAVDRDGIPTSIASNKFKHDEEIVATEQNPSATPLPSPSQVSRSDDSVAVTESMDPSTDDVGDNRSEAYFNGSEIGVIDDDDDDKEDDPDYVDATNNDDDDVDEDDDDDDDDGDDDSDDDGVDEILRQIVERAEQAEEEQRVSAAVATAKTEVLDINELSRKLHKIANQVASLRTTRQREPKDECMIFTVAPQHLCDGIRQYIIPLRSITQDAYDLLKRASGASSDDFYMTRHERIRLDVLLRIFDESVTYEDEDNRSPVGYKDYFDELRRVWPSYEKGAEPLLAKYLCKDREITTIRMHIFRNVL
jgi:hypothetical protein